MSIKSPPRRRAAALAVLTVGVAAVLAPAATAMANEGPAPAPRAHRIIAGVHTDAVSTFLDEGRFTLGTNADVEEGNGTRFAAEDVWFHLADDAKVTVPAGYEFIAAAGSQAWIAPESNPGAGRLWPGFSTESVPVGAVEGNQTSLTLTGVEGPGSLELFTAGGFGGAKRLWSSDEDGFRSFTIGRTHMHANWAFTAAGSYRIGVEAAVTLDGRRQAARATYTFVVGGLPAAAGTGTSLTASATTVVKGDRVALDATVTPPDATGWVEFLDGDTVLGHAPVAGGQASFDVTDPPLGNRSLRARFVPEVLNHFTPSASEPVLVTVTEKAGGEVFGISGLAGRYTAGEVIDLGVVGATLGEGEKWWWIIRPAGQSTEYVSGQSDRYTRDATVGLDGADIQLELRSATNKLVQHTDWHTIRVDGPNAGAGEPISISGMRDGYYGGDLVQVSVAHRPLAAGEAGHWVARGVPYEVEWVTWPEEMLPVAVPDTPHAYTIDTSLLNQVEWAYQIVDAAGVVVGRSPALWTTVTNRELLLFGLRTVYRAGDTIQAGSELYPARDGVAYQWGTVSGWEQTPIPGATSPSIEMPVTADLDGKRLYLLVTDAATGSVIGTVEKELRVTDAAPGEQLLLLDSLAGHYHQGNTIRLHAAAEPVAGDTDTYRWLWKRADQQDFTAIGDVVAATHEVRAEQALDGTQVKAELRSAAGDLLATSEPVTIHVDDHGAAPQQKVTVGGAADRYRVGENVELTASVAPASVLTRWEWFVQKPGEDTPRIVAGQNGARLSLAAAAAHDGAAVFARLTLDDGRRYAESAPVVLHVDVAAGPGAPVLSVSGMPDGEHQPGDAVTLQAVQTPQGPLTGYRWFVKRLGDADFGALAGETGASYGFTATRELHGAQYVVKLYDGDTAVATSTAVTLHVAAPQQGGGAAKSVTATIDPAEGALVISVDTADRAIVLPAAVLSATGDRWESSGALKPVTVTDTRPGRPGWTASGQIPEGLRTEDGKSFTGSYLGWAPTVTRQADQQGVVAGPVAVPYVPGQPHTGLGDSVALASAPAGKGLGTARLDATLTLSVPTDTAAGTYTGILTLTAI